jgi:hypothetical protein
MRHRSRTNALVQSVIGPFNQTWVGHNSYIVPANSVNHISHKDTEDMSDDPTGDRRAVKAVTHIREVINNINIDTNTLVSGSDTFISFGSNCWWHIWGDPGSTMESKYIRHSYPDTEENLVRATQHDFYNTNVVDNFVNLSELDDLLPSGFLKQAKTLGGILANARRVKSVKGKLGKLFRTSNALVSDGYLYYSFGIAPLISDMRKMSRAVSHFKEKLQKRVASADHPISVHRSLVGSVDSNLYLDLGKPGGYQVTPGDGGCWTAEVSSPIVPTLVCTVRGTRSVQFHSPVFQQLDNLIDRFGSAGPATFAWNKIPYSFVADWFVDISSVLDRIDNSLTGSTKKIQDTCISQKYQFHVKIQKVPPNGNTSDNMDGQVIGIRDYYLYTRKAAGSIPLIAPSGIFGKTQAALSAALISQLATKVSRR